MFAQVRVACLSTNHNWNMEYRFLTPLPAHSLPSPALGHVVEISRPTWVHWFLTQICGRCKVLLIKMESISCLTNNAQNCKKILTPIQHSLMPPSLSLYSWGHSMGQSNTCITLLLPHTVPSLTIPSNSFPFPPLRIAALQLNKLSRKVKCMVWNIFLGKETLLTAPMQ